MTDMQKQARILADPDICHCKPCIRGTRVMVSAIVDSLAAGESAEEIASAFRITVDDVEAARI